MDTTEARETLRALCAAATAPCLTDEQLELAVGAARQTRADGSVVWDLDRGARRGWELKAGNCAGAYDVTIDGQNLRRSTMLANCLEMVRLYRNRRAGTTDTGVATLPGVYPTIPVVQLDKSPGLIVTVQ